MSKRLYTRDELVIRVMEAKSKLPPRWGYLWKEMYCKGMTPKQTKQELCQARNMVSLKSIVLDKVQKLERLTAKL